ncbi:MAG: hypothetical protein JXX29_22680 [Deltaproteobacteria bacterium]|nr:hypothetical protein [Deltaproteobacteria bacterium]MBN2674504.1 hypothetical protein [Deltaproteobacteria bacterium]
MNYEYSYMASSTGMADNANMTASADMSQDWQAVYTYAQQLWDAGHRQQAEEYHAYAQQLYDAEQQRLSSAPPAVQPNNQTVSLTPVHYESSAPAAPSTPASTSTAPQEGKAPSWQVLYNYAQELYAAGNTQQAEEYYNKAQVLYADANPESDGTLPMQKPKNTTASQPEDAWTYTANTGSNAWGTSAASTDADDGAWASAGTPAIQPETRSNETVIISRDSITPAPSPKPRKRNIKRWTIATLAILFSVCCGAYVALYAHYNKQQRQSESEAVYYDATWSKIEQVTIQPVIRFLTPAFQKTNRLSVAAQPLLYELHLRNTPPESVSAQGAADADGTADVQAAGLVPTEEEPTAADSNTDDAAPNTAADDTATDTVDSDQSDETNEETIEPTADAADAESAPTPDDSQKIDPPPSPDMESAPDAALKTSNNPDSSARTESRSATSRKKARRSRRSRHNTAARRSKRSSQKKSGGLSRDPMKGMDL